MIHWLLQSTDAHPDLANGQPPGGLLSELEHARLSSLTIDKRRREWLLGRWTAKQLLRAYLERETGARFPLQSLIVGREPGGVPIAALDANHLQPGLFTGATASAIPLVAESWSKPGQAELVVRGVRLPLSLSISHSGDMAFCALGADPGGSGNGIESAPWPGEPETATCLAQVGADIERIEARSIRFVNDYFTRSEIELIRTVPATSRDVLVTAIWSAKEAVLKALHLGLTVDTRRVTCLCQPPQAQSPGWIPVTVTWDPTLLSASRTAPQNSASNTSTCTAIDGWWRQEGAYVLTLALLHD